MLDLIGQPALDPHDQGKVWVFSLGRRKDVGKPVLMYPFAITRIGVMANGVQPMKLGLAKELDQIEEAVSSGRHPEDPDIIS